MKPSILFIALLGILAAPVTRAEEPSVCKSVCTSEKQQCANRAGRLTELDNFPVEDRNSLARTASQLRSETAREAERSDFMKRKRERLDVCDASYLRCTRGCAPAPPASVNKTARR